MEVRFVREEDAERVYGMTEKFFAESPFLSELSAEPQSIANLVRTAARQEQLVGWVAEDKGELVGMLAVLIVPNPFNVSVLVADEMAWWVDPRYRKTLGSEMLSKAVSYCKDRGAKFFVMKYIHDGSVPIDKIQKVFKRKGFDTVETTVVKRL